MTEKEYLQNLGADFDSKDLNVTMFNRWRKKALDMAKACGAKFDPEPVELPPIKTIPCGFGHHGHCIGYEIVLVAPRIEDNGFKNQMLSREQADEVVRRCELINRIREYLKQVPLTTVAVDIINMINGKVVEW